MKAVILAGGLGTRAWLRKSHLRPKPMVVIGLVLLAGVAFQASTLLLVLAGTVPPGPVSSSNTVFRSGLIPVTPLSDR